MIRAHLREIAFPQPFSKKLHDTPHLLKVRRFLSCRESYALHVTRVSRQRRAQQSGLRRLDLKSKLLPEIMKTTPANPMQSEAPGDWFPYKYAAIRPVVNGWWLWIRRFQNRNARAVSFVFDVRPIVLCKLRITSKTVIMVPFGAGCVVMQQTKG